MSITTTAIAPNRLQRSLERLSEAAPAALLVMAVGLAAVIVVARSQPD